MIGDRYPDADIMGQRGHWDDATRRVVLDRVHNVPAFQFFDAPQQRTLEALCARVIPQAHKPPSRRVPIAPWIDQLCQEAQTTKTVEGFRFDDMPPLPTAWVWGLAGLDETAQALFGQLFADLGGSQQDEVLRALRAGGRRIGWGSFESGDAEASRPPPGAVWQRMPAARWFVYVALRQISGVYYAHPYAWDEIGFGGPAYPRGYFALSHGAPEPWEAEERQSEETERRGKADS